MRSVPNSVQSLSGRRHGSLSARYSVRITVIVKRTDYGAKRSDRRSLDAACRCRVRPSLTIVYGITWGFMIMICLLSDETIWAQFSGTELKSWEVFWSHDTMSVLLLRSRDSLILIIWRKNVLEYTRQRDTVEATSNLICTFADDELYEKIVAICRSTISFVSLLIVSVSISVIPRFRVYQRSSGIIDIGFNNWRRKLSIPYRVSRRGRISYEDKRARWCTVDDVASDCRLH